MNGAQAKSSTLFPTGTSVNDDEEGQAHDQLPSVEDVRIYAAAQLASLERATSPQTKSVTGNDDDQVHDQLPSLTEIFNGAQLDRRIPNYWITGCFVVLALLIGVAIGLGEGLSQGRQKTESSTTGPNVPTDFSRLATVTAWLTEKSISNAEDFRDQSSPQSQAALWISDVDTLEIQLPKQGESDSDFTFRYVLAVFFYAMEGKSWNSNLGFLSSRSTCSWNQLVVTSSINPEQKESFQVGVTCNALQEIIVLHLLENNLAGSIPTEIGHLTKLQYIGLERNHMIGTIPSEMTKLTLIDYFAMQYNFFTGELPTWLGELAKLRVLALGNNKFVGSLPKCFEKLTNLVTLGLDDNALTGDLTFLLPLYKMERLYLEDNQFSHRLNTTVLTNMRSLRELDLSTNHLIGTLPPTMFSYENLTLLDLNSNKLTGSIPSSISVNTKLTFISLYSNNLSGSIPSSISNCSFVTHLDLSDNQLTGEFPNEIQLITRLSYLFLAGNNFLAGDIPGWLKNLTSLKDLSLKSTNRSGPIPSFLGQLTNLILLDLHNNTLNGTIPSSLGDLTSLSFLLLNRNKLTGTVPQEIQVLSSIDMLLIDKTELNGSVGTLCSRNISSVKNSRVAIADCAGRPEINCSCCTLCCEDLLLNCNDGMSLAVLDPIWEHSFVRKYYEFSPELIFGSP